MLEVPPEAIVLVTLAASLVLFVSDALRYEIIALLVVLALALTGALEPAEAYAGFASPAIVLIGSMYVFGHAVTRWGIAEYVGQRWLLRGGRGEAGLALRVCLVSGLFSSVVSNTGVVAALIPVLSAVARRSGVPASRLMMPLAFGSLLGGSLTLIGTSHNIAVNQTLAAAGVPTFGLFEFGPLGLVLLALGCLYFWGPGRLLLPRRRLDQSLSDHYQVRKFVTEVLVEPSSTLINRAVAEVDLFERYGISVLGIVRPGAGDATLAPGPYNRIRSDDTLILQGEPDAILRLRTDLGLRQVDSVEAAGTRLASADVRLVEGVVPSGSRFVGQTLAESEFAAATGLNVLAVSKQGEVRLERLDKIRLETGDTLLLQGHLRDIQRARRTRELLVLDELPIAPIGQGAVLTVALLAAVLGAAMLGLDLSVAALGGAVGLVVLGVVKPEDALRAVSWPVLILVGGMLALGKAFERYGLAGELADWATHLGGPGGDPRVILAALMVTTVLLTQVLNHVSTAVIMTPVALSLAHTLGVHDRPFVIAVVFGAGMAFLSPVAHQANAMIVGPGDYRYRDFLRAGAVLTVVAAVVAVAIIPLLWPFA